MRERHILGHCYNVNCIKKEGTVIKLPNQSFFHYNDISNGHLSLLMNESKNTSTQKSAFYG